jgi:hypothetical protein
MKLGDTRTRQLIATVMEEARICAGYQKDDRGNILGYAAMATVFQCVLAVGESLTGSRNVEGCILAVLQHMESPQSWLLPPNGQPYTHSVASEVLGNLRNSLAHALMLPPDVALLPGRSFMPASLRNRWRLVVPEFIDSVDSAIARATQLDGNRRWDPTGHANRIAPIATYGTA